MTLTAWALSILAALFGIIITLAAAYAVARASYAKTQIEGLRGDRDDLVARSERLEREKQTLQVEVDQLRTALKALERVVTAKREIQELAATVAEFHKQSDAHTRRLFQTMEQILDTMQQGDQARA